MKTYEIIIDGNNVDLYDVFDLDLAITSSVSDAQNITVRKSSNTKTIKIPATGPNKIYFGHPHDINSVVSLNQSLKPSVIINADGVQIFIGYAKVIGSLEVGQTNIKEYQIECIGTNGDWVERIGGKNVNELDYSDQNHIWDYDTVLASETVIAGREYVYDFIDRGKFTGYAFSDGFSTVNIMDRNFALNMFSIVERIYKSIGYKLSSTFLNSAAFKGCYLPFLNEMVLQSTDKNALLVCDAIRGSGAVQYISYYTTYTGGTGISGLSGQVQALTYEMFGTVGNPSGAFGLKTPNYYFCKGKGKYRVRALVAFDVYNWTTIPTPTSSSVFTNLMKVNMFSEDGPQAIRFEELSTAFSGYHTGGTLNFDEVFECEFGDELFLEFNARDNGVIISFAEFEVVEVLGQISAGEGDLIEINLNLPNILQLEFLQGLKELFNLHFSADANSRTVYIEPYDEFYSLPTEDWSTKLDKAKDLAIQFTGSNLSRHMSYRYKDDSNDKFLQEWQKQTGLFYGAENSDVLNIFAKDEIKIISNKIFAATWMEATPQLKMPTTLIPRMWSDTVLPKRSTKTLPRILFYDGVKNLPSGEQWKFNQSGYWFWVLSNPLAGIRTTYPSFYMYSNTSENDNNLMYCDETYSSGLFQKHFRNAQNVMDDGRLYTGYINLTDSDMNLLDHRKSKYIEEQGNGAYFILDKVDNFKSQDGISTRCQFIKRIATLRKKELSFRTGTYVDVRITPIVTVGLSSTLDGSAIMIAGERVMEFSPGGEMRTVGGPIYSDADDVLAEIYYEDEMGNIERVIAG